MLTFVVVLVESVNETVSVVPERDSAIEISCWPVDWKLEVWLETTIEYKVCDVLWGATVMVEVKRF